MTIGLRYVGDPFVDCGVAVLTAVAGVDRPELVTTDHIEPFLEEIRPKYLNTYMANFLGTVVFSNINFANVGFNARPEYAAQRERQLTVWLRVYAEGAQAFDRLEPHERKKIEMADEGERCVFSGEPAVIRVSRTHIPLSSDQRAINFAPEGRPRLPVCGWVVLALMVMPMGGLSSGGRVLLPMTFDRALLQDLVRANIQKNRQEFALDGLASRPNYKFGRTQVLQTLLDVRRLSAGEYPITFYHFTSSEQGAKVDVYLLTTRVLAFVAEARQRYQSAWNNVVNRAHEGQAEAREKWNERKGGREIEYAEKNYFFEDLFRLPDSSEKFLRTYLLRQPPDRKYFGKSDLRRSYSPHSEREVISWGLIGLFLERIMDMQKTRIEAIKKMGDSLAEYIEKVDPRLYGKLYRNRKPDAIRLELIRAASKAKDAGITLIPLEQFIDVFFVDEGEFLQPDWYLASDLLLIRIIAQLSQSVIDANRTAIEEAEAQALDTEAT